MSELLLEVNNRRYGGWQEVRVRRSIEQLSATFDLRVTERWSGQAEPWPIQRGDACSVRLDGELAVTGYVDDTIPRFGAKSHSVQVIGRDKTADLIDCSAIFKTGRWRDRTLLQIAVDLVKPYGISVRIAAGIDIGARFKKFAIQESETVFEALDRLARMRGLLLISDGQGGLLISRAGRERIKTPLVQGRNILGGGGRLSLRDRYSDYIVKGCEPGSDWSTPEQNAQPQGIAKDPAVKRYRPLIIIAESSGNRDRLTDRAIWEAAVRMGRSARPVISVQGWRHASGLWLPNRLTKVDCPYLKLGREMLIVACTYIKGKSGTFTELELARPEAFELLAMPEPQEEDAWA